MDKAKALKAITAERNRLALASWGVGIPDGAAARREFELYAAERELRRGGREFAWALAYAAALEA